MTPFSDYFVPGIILFSVLGVCPLVVAWGLWRRRSWAWFGSVLVGTSLAIWILVEIVTIGINQRRRCRRSTDSEPCDPVTERGSISSTAAPRLDIEPEARVFEQIMANPWGLLPMLMHRVSQTKRAARVEAYQFPVIADERRVGSTLLQRILGIVDVTTDREVCEGVWIVASLRRILSGALWASAHPWHVLGSAAAAAWIASRWRAARR